MTYSLTLSSCDMMYPAPPDDDCVSKDLGVALEDLFHGGPALSTAVDGGEFKSWQGHGECGLEVWHELGAHPAISFKVTKDGKELFTLSINDLWETDALRRFCEMVIDHNHQTGAPDSPMR